MSVLLKTPLAAILTPMAYALSMPQLELAVTPVAPEASPVPTIFRRQAYSNTCGYENANILSSYTCDEGSACFSETQYNVAGYCCRIGNFASCSGPTACIPQTSLPSNCDADCTSNDRVTKCSNLQNPFCFTRYYFVGGLLTPSELGCTNTRGVSAFLYTTYTDYNTVDFDLTTPTAPLTTPSLSIVSTSSVQSGAESGASSSITGSASGTVSGNGDSNNGSGSDDASSTPIGAIAGGVVGGVVALAAAAIAITWMILRHRRQSRALRTGGGLDTAPSGSGNVGESAAHSEPKPSQPLLSTSYVSTEPQEMGMNDRVHELYENRELRPELGSRY